ncbi:MATE family efflux transporter [Owenweeksia hongkongensis]|uniref:MATE family efflux transporter n=1 Tax=Owenweeksia hongkongensis TaxID=253245 RepID=UPI003A907AC9
MTTKEHISKNFHLAWPVMLGQLGHVMVGLADSIMIGQIGTIPLAAAAFANSIFVIPMVFGMGMAFGLTTPIANADGEGRADKAGSYLRHGLALNMFVALLIFLILLGFSQITHLLGQEPEVVSLSGSYLMIITSSIFPFMLFLTFKQFAEGLSLTRFAMVASILANLLNVLFNYILIYGHWGFPALGLDGAGIATLTSRIIMAAMMYLYVFKGKQFKSYLQHYKHIEWKRKQFRKITQVGVPSGLQYIFEVSAFAIAAVIVGQISAEALAAHQIAISLASLSYMMATGLGAAAAVRVGNQLGKRDYPTLRAAARTTFAMTLVFMAACGFLFFFGRNMFPLFYTDDLYVAGIASQLLIIAVVFQLSDGVQVVALGALRGMSDTIIPTFISFFSYWGMGLLPAYFMGITLDMGPQGVWYGLALGLTVASILLYWRFEHKVKQLIHE